MSKPTLDDLTGVWIINFKKQNIQIATNNKALADAIVNDLSLRVNSVPEGFFDDIDKNDSHKLG